MSLNFEMSHKHTERIIVQKRLPHKNTHAKQKKEKPLSSKTKRWKWVLHPKNHKNQHSETNEQERLTVLDRWFPSYTIQRSSQPNNYPHLPRLNQRTSFSIHIWVNVSSQRSTVRSAARWLLYYTTKNTRCFLRKRKKK